MSQFQLYSAATLNGLAYYIPGDEAGDLIRFTSLDYRQKIRISDGD